jgi:GMP synthase (glutamine-hydrolysing)
LVIDGTLPQGAPAQAPTSPPWGAETFCVGAVFFDLLDTLHPGAEIIILPLAEGDDERAYPLEQWDGVIWAADSGAASVCAQPQAFLDRALALMDACFSAHLPQFGSGWGLHVAVLCAGGEVILDPHGGSFPFARNIHLTQCGVTHPMMHGRRLAFTAPSLHPDSLETLPNDAQVLAVGPQNAIQACEIFWRGGSFWGTQYQPENDLREIALFCQRDAKRLIAEGWFADSGQLAAFARRCIDCQMNNRRDLRLGLGIDDDITADRLRQNELRQWLNAIGFAV